eukprot:TRINITY_DN692_c0_g1_i2.p1 TRINITY_DN692_c0_g1~~TRINITY_DN692_c0_g1_i2.p1  ORF type:complete len:186 (-),score=23.32 TRINITY_DN692_c0_g1_i2:317-874(-)
MEIPLHPIEGPRLVGGAGPFDFHAFYGGFDFPTCRVVPVGTNPDQFPTAAPPVIKTSRVRGRSNLRASSSRRSRSVPPTPLRGGLGSPKSPRSPRESPVFEALEYYRLPALEPARKKGPGMLSAKKKYEELEGPGGLSQKKKYDELELPEKKKYDELEGSEENKYDDLGRLEETLMIELGSSAPK